MFCSWLPSLVVCPFYIKKKNNKTSWTGLYNIRHPPVLFFFPSKMFNNTFFNGSILFLYNNNSWSADVWWSAHFFYLFLFRLTVTQRDIYIYIYARPPLYIFWKHESHFLNKFTPFHTSMNLGFDFPRKKKQNPPSIVLFYCYIYIDGHHHHHITEVDTWTSIQEEKTTQKIDAQSDGRG